MASAEDLFSPLRFLKGIGPARAEALAARGLRTIHDLLTWLPRRHYDRRLLRTIREARPGDTETLQAVILSMRTERTSRRRMTIFRARLGDETGEIDAVWFQQPYLERVFRVGDVVLVSGKVDRFRGGAQIKPEEYEILAEDGQPPVHVGGFIPAYPPVEAFGRRALRSLIRHAVERWAPAIEDPLHAELRRKRGLMPLGQALRAAHFPETLEEQGRARRRLAYDELFLLQVGLARRKRRIQAQAPEYRLRISDEIDARIRLRFPFAPTRAQDRVLKELRADLCAGRPMNRLLQGDVGSGKTVAAVYAALAAVANGKQAAVMAPTEILADQHERTFRRFLEGSRVRIARLSGGRATKASKELRAQAADGSADVVIGTHALLEPDVTFASLAVAVIDEQQKFGVHQRAGLRHKGRRPHVLVMTATPIPRTLALTLLGDLDVSTLDEAPPGRHPVTTLVRTGSARAEEMAFVRKLLREGRQAYFVSPVIEESARLEVESVTTLHARLVKDLEGFRVGLLHGRMKPDEKDAAMEAFRRGEVSALVSTVVIEVGVDVPNATVMVVENAERFGLSQLHQLRGRVARGTHEGYCILFADARTDEGRERLKVLAETSDGFKIAEADLRIRGPGEFLGTRQSGLPEFRAADLAQDLQLLQWAREDAFRLVASDPELTASTGPLIRAHLEGRGLSRASLITVG